MTKSNAIAEKKNMTPERKRYLGYGMSWIPAWKELSEEDRQICIEYNKAWLSTR